MKSKIIKAVGKEILSLVLSIIGLLFVGHWLYSISMDSFRLYWQCSIFMH